MKARLLRNLLNNTGYIISNNKKHIAIESPMAELILVMKKDYSMHYAFDTFKQGGRACIEKEGPKELLDIWIKLEELIESGEIKDIIEGQDVVENPLPVYTIDEDGRLVEAFTDKYGWPNTTLDGYVMYDNTYFQNKEDAIKFGVRDLELSIKHDQENIKDLEAALNFGRKRIYSSKIFLNVLNCVLEGKTIGFKLTYGIDFIDPNKKEEYTVLKQGDSIDEILDRIWNDITDVVDGVSSIHLVSHEAISDADVWYKYLSELLPSEFRNVYI